MIKRWTSGSVVLLAFFALGASPVTAAPAPGTTAQVSKGQDTTTHATAQGPRWHSARQHCVACW
jgi:hypothetical protein